MCVVDEGRVRHHLQLCAVKADAGHGKRCGDVHVGREIRHPLACGPLEQRHRPAEMIEVEFHSFDIGYALPCRRWFGHRDLDRIGAGHTHRLQRIQAADAARGHIEQRPVFCCRGLEPRAQGIVAECAAGKEDQRDARFEQRPRKLAHRIVRGGLDHHLRVLGQ